MGSPSAVPVAAVAGGLDEAGAPGEPAAVVVCVFALTGSAAWRGWKPSTAAVPKTVAAMTMGERLIGGGSSEGE
jgi:hypothetical protein